MSCKLICLFVFFFFHWAGIVAFPGLRYLLICFVSLSVYLWLFHWAGIVAFPGLGCLLMSCKLICLFVAFSLGCECGISCFRLFVNLSCKFICLHMAFFTGQ